jgi:hypothetical protein
MNSIDKLVQGYDFITIRDAYTKMRRIQRDNIVRKLQTLADFEFTFTGEKGKEIDPLHYNSGRGSQNYSSQGSTKPYNLNNWQWISIEYKSIEFLISFNAYEQDSDTKDPHALYDRIAFQIRDDSKAIVFTKYDLPLSDNEVGEVVQDFVKFCKDRSEGQRITEWG